MHVENHGCVNSFVDKFDFEHEDNASNPYKMIFLPKEFIYNYVSKRPFELY